MENDMQTQPPQPKQHHVHPFVAWMAVFNFAMIFSLAPSMILAQEPTPSMSEGSAAMAVRLPESTMLAYAKHVAAVTEGVKPKTETTKPKTEGKSEGKSKESPCIRSCRITKSDCTRSSAGDVDGTQFCMAKFQNCVRQCVADAKVVKEKMNVDLKTANQNYLDALKAAREKRTAALLQAQTTFESDMKKAKADDDAAKAAIKASSTTTSSSTSS